MSLKHSLAREALDQFAHFAIGFAAVMVAIFIGVDPWVAVVGIMASAVAREYRQHDGWHLGAGSIRDLAFWLAGALLAAFVL